MEKNIETFWNNFKLVKCPKCNSEIFSFNENADEIEKNGCLNCRTDNWKPIIVVFRAMVRIEK